MRRILIVVLLLASISIAAGAEWAPKWKTSLGQEAVDAVAAGKAVYTAAISEITAIDLERGDKIWSCPFAAVSSLAANETKVWVSGGGKLSVIDAATGKIVKNQNLPFKQLLLAPAPVNNRLLAETDRGSALLDADGLKTLYQSKEPLFDERRALLKQTGKWRARINEAKNLVYFVADGKLTAVDLTSGKIKFTSAAVSGLVGWPTVLGDTVLAFAPESLVCFNGDDGGIKWTSKVPTPQPINPLIVFAGPTQRLTFVYPGGLLHHHPDKNKIQIYYPIPERVWPIRAEGEDTFFLYIYTDETDQQMKSAVMRLSQKTAQLYGRSPATGETGGWVVFGKNQVLAELAPGQLQLMDRWELKRIDTFVLPNDRLIYLAATEAKAVAVSQKGVVAGLALK